MALHTDPEHCRRGFLGTRCPACADWWRNAFEARIAIAEATDLTCRDALHWMVDQGEPSEVLRALKGALE